MIGGDELFNSSKEMLLSKDGIDLLSLSKYNKSYENLVTKAKEIISDSKFFVLSISKQNVAIGLIVLKKIDRDDYEVVSLGVLESYRTMGYASKLLKEAITILKARTVFAETDDEAVGFYIRFGFQVSKRTKAANYPQRYTCEYYV